MGRLEERKIPLYYKPPFVTPGELEKIIRFYDNGIQFADMLRKLQSARPERRARCLSYCDVYTILYNAATTGKVSQRRTPDTEMPIADFALFYKQFCKGGTLEECLAEMSESGRKTTSLAFASRLFRSMSERWRDEKREHLDTLDPKPVVKELNDLPLSLLRDISSLGTDISKRLAIFTDPTLRSMEQVMHKIDIDVDNQFPDAEKGSDKPASASRPELQSPRLRPPTSGDLDKIDNPEPVEAPDLDSLLDDDPLEPEQ
jgi:hypothetical protein